MYGSRKLFARTCAENLKGIEQMKIVTLTLNPAFDMHCFVNSFRPYHENIAEINSFEAGGKGVNISRALTYNNTENVAVIVVGDENSEEFERQLKKDNMNFKLIKTHGRIRENITLHSGDGKDETRLSFHGFVCSNNILQRVAESIGEVNDDTIVTITGSIPDGVSINDTEKFLNVLRMRGAKIVIDSRSFTFEDLASFKPWLIKPNEDEASAYLNMPIKTLQDGIVAAKKLQETGIENILLSLGGKGAILASKSRIYSARAPKINAISTIGAGDSMVAGFLSAYISDENSQDCLKRAVAFGSAACLREGTLPPLPIDVEKFESIIEIDI